jgi:hypothetical protein
VHCSVVEAAHRRHESTVKAAEIALEIGCNRLIAF